MKDQNRKRLAESIPVHVILSQNCEYYKLLYVLNKKIIKEISQFVRLWWSLIG